MSCVQRVNALDRDSRARRAQRQIAFNQGGINGAASRQTKSRRCKLRECRVGIGAGREMHENHRIALEVRDVQAEFPSQTWVAALEGDDQLIQARAERTFGCCQHGRRAQSSHSSYQ